MAEYSTKDITNNIQKEKIRNRIFADHQYFSTERHHRLIDKFSGLLKKAELRYGAFEYLGHTDIRNNPEVLVADGLTDEIKWYEEKFGTPPLYDEVIGMLAKTSSERNGLLKEFFEPTEEDLREGRYQQ